MDVRSRAGRPLRVAVIVPWGERLGGAEMFLWTWLSNLDPTVISPLVIFLEAGPFVDDVAGLGVRVAVKRARRLRNPVAFISTVGQLVTLFRRERPDAIMNWSAKTHLYGGVAAAVAGMSRRVLWWQHGIADAHWLHRVATLVPTQLVAAPSEAAARSQSRLWPRRRTAVVNPGVEDHFPSDANRTDLLRRRLGLPTAVPIVGIVGRLEPWKGQDRFLRMIDRLLRVGQAVHGVLVGGDAYDLFPDFHREVVRLVTELGLSQFVTVTGHAANARDYIHAMDVFVSASTGEPFGIVIIEALAAGVPVVAVAQGGPLEILAGGGGGILIPNGDPTTMATAVKQLITDDQLRRQLSRAGRRRYEDRFTATVMAARLEALLKSVVVVGTSRGPR